MRFTMNETNKDDVWSAEDLLECKYNPGVQGSRAQVFCVAKTSSL